MSHKSSLHSVQSIQTSVLGFITVATGVYIVEQLALGPHERYITINTRTKRIIVCFVGG
jgi:hypothetical protein